MKQLTAILSVVFLGFGAAAQDSTPTVDAPSAGFEIRNANDVTLDEYLWLNRLIVVFADTDRDPAFQKQIALLMAQSDDLLARDVVVITDTDPKPLSGIREKLRPRGFGFVLIDKDGGVKLRKATPWEVRDISRSIDKTELRQQELRDARNGGS